MDVEKNGGVNWDLNEHFVGYELNVGRVAGGLREWRSWGHHHLQIVDATALNQKIQLVKTEEGWWRMILDPSTTFHLPSWDTAQRRQESRRFDPTTTTSAINWK